MGAIILLIKHCDYHDIFKCRCGAVMKPIDMEGDWTLIYKCFECNLMKSRNMKDEWKRKESKGMEVN